MSSLVVDTMHGGGAVGAVLGEVWSAKAFASSALASRHIFLATISFVNNTGQASIATTTAAAALPRRQALVVKQFEQIGQWQSGG
eukprot:COSAG06_NODE_485_length_15117_cov_5.922493_7_plen_85_part_00